MLALAFLLLIIACTRNKEYEKGFSVSPESRSADEKQDDGIYKDSVSFKTRPGSVLLTGLAKYRLTPVYKLNYNKNDQSYFTGDNSFYSCYDESGDNNGNHWHNNFMPGLQAVYGFNMVNVSHYNAEIRKQSMLFPRPVLIKTLYFPAFSSDTLNNQPVNRNYYLISAYDDDSNKDGLINPKDMRHLYVFDMDGLNKKALIPNNYSVISSAYDPANDFMFVYAQLDENNNGQRDATENIHVFWIDLKNPINNGMQY
jgi:hypothetical protein